MKYRQKFIFASIALLNVVLHFLPAFSFEYHRDELLYFSFANHLDFGYATTPPLIGFMAFISKALFGYSVFSIRFFPSLFSGLLVYLTVLIAKELNGGFRSQLISAMGVVGTMFLAMIYGIFTPYFFDIFNWTLIIYLLIRFVKTNSGNYLLALGIVIGIALLNKYNIIFLVVSVLIILPFTKYRYVFRNRYFYWGIILSLLIFSPNIIWQMQHNLPVINHMKELNESQLTNVSRIEFFVGQLVLLLPFTLIVVPGIIYFFLNQQYKDFRFLLSATAIVIILFLIFRGKSFYTSGLYPFLIVVGALFVEKVIVNRYLYSTIVFVLLITSVLLLPLNLPLFNYQQLIGYYDSFAKITRIDLLRKDEDGQYRKLPQVNADMLGWDEITEITNKAWCMVEDKNKCFIFCANYGQAGAISIIGKKYGLPEPVSFSDSYRFWIPGKFEKTIEEVIYVVGADAMDSGNFRDTKDFFQEMVEIGHVDNRLAIEYNTRVYLFRQPKSNFNDFWENQIIQ